MQFWTDRAVCRPSGPTSAPVFRFRRLEGVMIAGVAAIALLVPAVARAQYARPETQASSAVGENYHVEVGGTLWNPDVAGQISSEQFGIIGSNIDFVDDLAFTKTRFKDLRIVLRPTRKAKFRIEYTPIEYTAETTLKRDIIFNGQKFPVSLPISSTFDWKVWRFGYEYDLLYRSRGFVGLLLEGRYTQMNAELNSPVVDEFTTAKAPLPALGIVARGYVLPDVALNFELSGFKLPPTWVKGYEANYYDWDIHGTVNVTNNFGLQAGWRRMTTFLSIKSDLGDVKFQGLWFGAALRY
jgi:hypothetical protein